MKQRIKILLGHIVFSLRLHRIFLRNRAVIVAFHSVNEDAAHSDINCLPKLFAEYCQFFKRYFEVISLSSLLQRIREQQSVDGCLVVTFDDGYADNLHIAAPILSQAGLPATFFVTTGFIGSDTVAPWDAEINIESKWMSWDELATLHQQGFDIGGHTVTHTNLAEAPGEVAKAEIFECRKTLQDRLQADIPNFAYPFGGRDNFTASCLQLVREAGFECSMSCHGGTVTAGEDVYALHREPITTRHVSPYHFGFDCVLDRVRRENTDRGYL